MANELAATITVIYNKPTGAASVSESVNMTRQIDIDAGAAAKATQTIGTSEEQFAMVDVASARYIYVQNLDVTNFVQVGTAAGEYSIKLLPGDHALFPPNASALFLKADTAACKVSILALNA